jgi:Zn-dependent peptidase ImmA (M78 family)
MEGIAMSSLKGMLSGQERLQIKDLAEDTRLRWARKGYCDIFAILDSCSLLIRKPLESKTSGFSTFFEEHFIVVLNTNFTLGHERFTGAHELYHLTYNQDVLRRERLLYENENEEEKKAQGFAAEFLMPEDGVKESFFKLVGEDVKTDKVEVRHIIRLQHVFQVSYTAMLKRLVQLQICAAKRYDFLRGYATPERAVELQELTIQEGKDIRLIIPSHVNSISDEYLQFVRNNFEKQKISYGKLYEVLEYVGKTPETFGYEKPGEIE